MVGQTDRRAALNAAREIAPLIREAQQAGHRFPNAIAEYINSKQKSTPRGKQWTSIAVVHAMTHSEHLAND
jgi:hypothetical protein